MKIQKAIKKETLHIAEGTLAISAVMCAVFALLHKFSFAVVLGALLGSAVAILNFFLLGLSVQAAMQKGEHAAAYMKRIYTLRMMGCALCVVGAVLTPSIHTFAFILPLFFPQIVIFAMRLLGLVKDEETNEETKEGTEL